jgi:hypothetical protein
MIDAMIRASGELCRNSSDRVKRTRELIASTREVLDNFSSSSKLQQSRNPEPEPVAALPLSRFVLNQI